MEWPKYFFLSVAAHLAIITFVLSISFKTPKVMETISVDFTIVNSDYGTNKKGIGRGTGGQTGDRGQKESFNRGNERKIDQGQDKTQDNSKINTASDKRDTISLNPVKGERDDFLEEDYPHIRVAKAGSGYSGISSGSLTGGSGGSGYGRGTGGGGGSGAGQGGGINLEDYNYVRDAVMKNITYPEKARRMGIEGRVIISFVINEAGFINDIKILKSSGYTLLDEAVKDAILKVYQFRKKPQRLFVQLPVEFRLR
ncbi:MAG: energy transducer TonB [Syntrophorhabdaceae bacterium]|nr:energy transducer TonB [Syntrophorhabdaceae bacterium]